MSAAIARVRDVPAGRPTDVRRSTRVLAAVLLPVGPASVAVLRFVLPYATIDDGAAIVEKVSADPQAQSLVLWLGLVATLTLVPAVLWVGRLTRRRAPRLTAAALLLLVPGYLGMTVMLAGDLLLWVGVHNGVDTAALARMYESSHPIFFIAIGLFVLGHVLGTILLGSAMWRSRTVPRWAALMTVASQPLHFVAAVILVSPPLDLVAWGLNAAGFAAASVAILRLPDEYWDLLPPTPTPAYRSSLPGVRNGLCS